MPKFAANLTMLFNEVGFLDRFDAAARAGFTGRRISVSVRLRPAGTARARLDEHGLTQVLHNLPAGNWGGRRARHRVSSRSRRRSSTTASSAPIEYATALGCTQLNCLAGIVPPGVERGRARGDVCRQPARRGATSAGCRHPAADRTDQHARHPRLLPADHRAGARDHRRGRIGQSVPAVRRLPHADHGRRSGDARSSRTSRGSRTSRSPINPGRHEPGTGEINYDFLFDFIDRIGYPGWIGCEYKPTAATEAGSGLDDAARRRSHEADDGSDRLHRSRHHGPAHGPQSDQRRAHALSSLAQRRARGSDRRRRHAPARSAQDVASQSDDRHHDGARHAGRRGGALRNRWRRARPERAARSSST